MADDVSIWRARGLYGMVTHSVERRTREVRIRQALGAPGGASAAGLRRAPAIIEAFLR